MKTPTLSSKTHTAGQPLLTTQQVAQFLAVSVDYLCRDRQRPMPTIPVVRLGRRLDRYQPVDVQDALERLTRGRSSTKITQAPARPHGPEDSNHAGACANREPGI